MLRWCSGALDAPATSRVSGLGFLLLEFREFASTIFRRCFVDFPCFSDPVLKMFEDVFMCFPSTQEFQHC